MRLVGSQKKVKEFFSWIKNIIKSLFNRNKQKAQEAKDVQKDAKDATSNVNKAYDAAKNSDGLAEDRAYARKSMKYVEDKIVTLEKPIAFLMPRNQRVPIDGPREFANFYKFVNQGLPTTTQAFVDIDFKSAKYTEKQDIAKTFIPKFEELSRIYTFLEMDGRSSVRFKAIERETHNYRMGYLLDEVEESLLKLAQGLDHLEAGMKKLESIETPIIKLVKELQDKKDDPEADSIELLKIWLRMSQSLTGLHVKSNQIIFAVIDDMVKIVNDFK